MHAVIDHLGRAYLRVDAWANHPENARVIRPTLGILILASLVLMGLVAAAPLIVVLAMVAGVFLLVRAWHREFAFLMRLDDDAFPGRNDKAIWAVLLIVLPPVGLWLFRSHRLAMWPESEKPAAVADELV